MKRWLHLLRTMMALCAIVAYGFPVVTHGAVAHHAAPAAQQLSTMPCDHGSAADHHHMHERAVGDSSDAAPGEPVKCPGHKEGSTSCCVAMCHAALPMPECAALWVPPLRAASDNLIIDPVGPTFITRLDRPPKPSAALIG